MSIFHRNQSNSECFYVFKDPFETSSQLVALLGVLIFTMFFIIITNILLIHGLRATTKNNKKLSLTKKLFVYLSSTDLFTGFVSVPFQIWMLIISKDASCTQTAIQAFVNAFTPALAMFTLLSISATRYLSVAQPNFYREHVRHPKVTIVLVLQAAAALGLTIWYVVATQSNTHHLLGIFLIFVTFLCFGTIGTAVVVNFRLFFFLKKHNEHSMIVRGRETNAAYQTEVAKTLLLISLVLVLCYLPNGIAFSIVGYHVFRGDSQSDTYNYYVPWAHVPMLLNAGFNSLIYIRRNKNIYFYYKRLLCTKNSVDSTGDMKFPKVISTTTNDKVQMLIGPEDKNTLFSLSRGSHFR